MLYRPVIDDCAEFKQLPFPVMYRFLVFFFVSLPQLAIV